MLLIILVISGCSQKELTWDDLVTRGDITYIKFTETPFTGNVSCAKTDCVINSRATILIVFIM